MVIKFLDLSANYQPIRDEINYNIQKVLNKNNYILGEELTNFEITLHNFVILNIVSVLQMELML